MRRTLRALLLAALLSAATVPAANAASPWLSARDGWKPVPHAIRAQLAEDGVRLGRHARIRYGDTTVIDLDGRPGGRRVTS
jgi:hypothetical protein